MKLTAMPMSESITATAEPDRVAIERWEDEGGAPLAEEERFHPAPGPNPAGGAGRGRNADARSALPARHERRSMLRSPSAGTLATRWGQGEAVL